MVLTCAFATAQTNQAVWLNGKVLYGHPIASIDSMTYDMNGMIEGDTLHLIMPRSTVYVVHDTIVKANTMYVKDTIYINKCGSKGQGIFTVSADKQVSFAKGNLQYQASTKTWRFAENQYDYIGSDNSNISDTHSGWIDLFGWGTSNNPTNASTDDNDYQTFVDWGTNTIGSDAPNTWRTLSADEWYYIFYTRTNAPKLFGIGSVNGTIILPNDWTTPTDVTFIPSTEKGLTDQGGYYYDSSNSHWSDNTYTLSDWQKMEDAGAVFLPAAGYRSGQGVGNVQNGGHYWASAAYNSDNAYYLYFYGPSLYPQNYSVRRVGFSVRLVQDISLTSH